ncbi:MAG TPA: biopolymer transporter ExbB [Xanthomonadales bacterium]|nr:biopolymer transporter ExbB [Xanthomonadales bacterium]
MLQDTDTTATVEQAAPAAASPASTLAATPAQQTTSTLGTGLTDSDAAAFQQMGFDHMIANLDSVGWAVLITLIVMSLSSWYFTVINAIKNAVINSRADRVVRGFWQAANREEAAQLMEQQPKNEPFSKIALDAHNAAQRHDKSGESSRLSEVLNRSEFIDRALRQAVARESARLETGMTLLATVGSTAPFVGLLGTVWGIYHALIAIGASGQSSIEAVAGPVGEALIMTAIGLFVAIPAVIAYNAFNRANRNTNEKFDTFAHDLHDSYATGGPQTGGR